MLTAAFAVALALLQPALVQYDRQASVAAPDSKESLLRHQSFDRISAALPEALNDGRGTSATFLSEAARDWSDRLTSSRQMDVAMLVLLSYGLPDRTSPHVRANTALAVAFLAAEVAAGGAASGSEREHDLDTGTSGLHSSATGPNREGRALRALAWGERLGICEAAFVATLRTLPGPEARGDGLREPDMRRVLRDLGSLAYDNQSSCGDGN